MFGLFASPQELIVSTATIDQLKTAVTRLSSSHVEQIEYLRSIKTYPSADELALEFHDLALSIEHLQATYTISNAALSLVALLDKKLDSFSGENYAHDWNAHALASSRNWAEVRSIAKQLLDALD